jgi:hypothetical protein
MNVPRVKAYRRTALWFCLAVFVTRVLGQVEVRLLAPHWLPKFEAWSSGFVPYSLLLPVQILLIAWMAVVATDQWRGGGRFWISDRRKSMVLRSFALLYAASMLLRLLLTIAFPPHTVLDRGLIPILAHWSLAAFIFLVAANPIDDAANTRSVVVTRRARPIGHH